MKVRSSPFEKIERNFLFYEKVIQKHRTIVEVAKEYQVSPAVVKNAIINVYQKQCLAYEIAPLGWTIKVMRCDNRFEPNLSRSNGD